MYHNAQDDTDQVNPLTVGILMPLKGGVPRPQALSILDRWHWAHCIVLGGRNMLPLVEK